MTDSPLLFSPSDVTLHGIPHHAADAPPQELDASVLADLLAAAQVDDAHPSVRFWSACAEFALNLVARARVLPVDAGVGRIGWRVGPLDPTDVEQRARLIGALPDGSVATQEQTGQDHRGQDFAERAVQAFLDGVADTLTPAPGPAEASSAVDHDEWIGQLAARLDPQLRVSLRIELADPVSDGSPETTAVVQVQRRNQPGAGVRDAGALWAGAGAQQERMETLLVLRRVATVWAPLGQLLSQPVPDRIALEDDELTQLQDAAAAELSRQGIEVHWPRDLTAGLEAQLMINSDDEISFGSTAPGQTFDWNLRLDGRNLDPAEIDRLRTASSPIVALRNRWVLIDSDTASRLKRPNGTMTAMEALAAVLSGRAKVDSGAPVEVVSTGALEQVRARLALEPAAAVITPPVGLEATLRDYQLVGMQWMARMTALGLGVCLADDMGLGKTISLIALHLHLLESAGVDRVRTLIICPASLLGNWEREITRFSPGVAVRRFHGPGRNLSGLSDGFVLTTYATMRLDAETLADPDLQWDLVVLDEAQHVKNPRASTARAVRTISSRSRIALTGTPVENNLTDLWAILDWASPGLLGTLGRFRQRWAEPIESGVEPASAAAFSRLVAPFVLRRRKSDPDIAPELPPKTETDQPVELTAEQIALYQQVVADTMAQLSDTDGFQRRGLIMKLLTACKQICNHPAQYLKEDHPVLAGRSGKLDVLDELLDTIRAEDGAVLIFTQYVAMARLLEQHLQRRKINTLLLHGGTPVAQRERMVEDFQTNEGIAPVFLLSLKAAGTGLNLTRADHVIHLDRWWNPAVEDQASDRAYRIGQTRPVQVHRLIAEGTVEDKIAAMLSIKRDLAASVLQVGETALSELSNAELGDLFAWEGRS